MVMPSPPIFHPLVVTRASTAAMSAAVTLILASPVSTRTLAVCSRLKVFAHSSGEDDGVPTNSSMQITKIISYLLKRSCPGASFGGAPYSFGAPGVGCLYHASRVFLLTLSGV